MSHFQFKMMRLKYAVYRNIGHLWIEGYSKDVWRISIQRKFS
uniref:Uncharacterized protein n=1 Tax=Arundo donax TaxID=35708 RepID=A0A0A9FFZ1_ARUDO